MAPSFQCGDFDAVDLKRGPVLYATYGPASGAQPKNVTEALRQIQLTPCSDNLQVTGGIHTRIGDPFPGVAKVLKIWFANEPSQTFEDFQEVNFAGQVVRASYAPAGHGNGYKDATEEVQALQGQGINHVTGGIHTKIGDDFPGQAKVFKVWYA